MEAMHPGSTPPQQQTTVRDLVAVIFRQKWIILTLFAVTTISVFLFNLRTATTWESSARVRVERGRKETTLTPNLRVLPWKEEISSEIETVKSYPVARQAQAIVDEWYESGRINQQITINRAGVEAGVIGESNVLDITYASQDASACRPVTDAVTMAYTEFRSESDEFPRAARFFEDRITEVETKLSDLERSKIELLARIGGGASRMREDDVGEMLRGVQANVLEEESRLRRLKSQLRVAEALAAEQDADSPYFTQLKFENAWMLNQIREEVLRSRMERDELAATLQPSHPKYKAAQQALDSAERTLNDEVASTVALIRSEIEDSEESLTLSREQERRLSTEFNNIPKYQIDLEVVDHEIKVARDELRELKGKQIQSQVNQATSQEYTLTMLSPASAPYAKNTRDYVRMALAPIMSLVVGLLLAFFVDSLDHSLRTRQEVEEQLGLPVLASLPETRK